jgi:hypothetical protein
MSIKIITSVYNDEHKLNRWIGNIKNANIDYIVYKKNDQLKEGEYNRITDNRIEIPNIGRCDYSFLYHIIQNYHTLADTNIFVKCNWFENNIRFWDLLAKCSQYDYMQVGTHPEIVNWDDFSIGDDGMCENKNKWLMEIFPDNCNNLGNIPGWGHGPAFSVSRELIHRHEKSVYENMLNKFHESSNSFSTDYEKYNYKTYNDLLVDVGINYHNELGRFYMILFTHNLPKDGKYKIFTYAESAELNNIVKNKKRRKMQFL